MSITLHNLRCVLYWAAELIRGPPDLHSRNSDLVTDLPRLHYSGSATYKEHSISELDGNSLQ